MLKIVFNSIVFITCVLLSGYSFGQNGMAGSKLGEDEQPTSYAEDKARAYRSAGDQFYTDELYVEAIEEYTKAINENPEERVAWYNRALCRIKMEDVPAAIVDLNEMIVLFPGFVSAYYLRGTLHYDTSDWKHAKIDFSKIIDIRENDALIYRKRGTTRYQLKDRSGALNDYNRAIELNPNDPIAFHDRGITREYLGDKKGAKMDYEMAKELDLAAAKKASK